MLLRKIECTLGGASQHLADLGDLLASSSADRNAMPLPFSSAVPPRKLRPAGRTRLITMKPR